MVLKFNDQSASTKDKLRKGVITDQRLDEEKFHIIFVPRLLHHTTELELKLAAYDG